jgi:anti-sigma regulatory factor (Ser/Thr protein kinase)
VSWGRRILRHLLREWQLEAMSGTALQLVSELIANAVPTGGARRDQQSRQMIVLTVKLTDASLLLEVWDAYPVMPALREADVSGDCGRGLLRVDFLSDRWGHRGADGGKVVWCEVMLPGTRSG